MPRIPTYRRHNTGQAFVELGGHRRYLGQHGTPESRQAYDRLIAEYLAGGRTKPHQAGEEVLVVELISRFREYAQGYYRRRDGTPTKTIFDVQSALRVVRELYGRTVAESFSPKCLHTVQTAYIRKGWNRATVNSRVKWVRRLFKWGVALELVKAPTWQALLAVEPLKAGRSEAPEPGRVGPVPEPMIRAIKPFVNRHIWGLIQLQLLTGARGGELLKLRAVDFDMKTEAWTYKPDDHKNAYHYISFEKTRAARKQKERSYLDHASRPGEGQDAPQSALILRTE